VNKIENFFVGENSFWNVIIVIAVLTVLISGIIIGMEVLEAKKYCKSVDGEYSLKINTQPHHCNGKNILKYDGYWDFMENIELKLGKFVYNPQLFENR